MKIINDALSGLRKVLATENPFKIMKNAFYFALKAVFVHKILKFLSGLFGYVKNGLIGKIRLISQFMMSQSGKQTVAQYPIK